MKCENRKEDTESQELDWRIVCFYRELDVRINRNNKDTMFLINEMQRKIEWLVETVKETSNFAHNLAITVEIQKEKIKKLEARK